ncbi:hypothetical protein [Kingella sp. (in: b-proteobacteria)]|uniref:hypothetical protein n=1 Tax=Kingella sp. (in: b-proteobacteria) TaxID=2020713 RepID=UPI0026DA9B42|nr:hypothetical protein [Kingella sp. (in: b-proteobacteria)]MDO4657938.1 hypothetical protein [Kingella sp. (in: b-proteobacteria)]
MYPSPANTGYADNYWGCQDPGYYGEPTNYLGELYSEWQDRIADQYRAQAIAKIRSDLQRYDNCEQELAELAAAEAGQGDEDTENDIWATILEIAQANHDTF